MYGGDVLLGNCLAYERVRVGFACPHGGRSPMMGVGGFLLLLDDTCFGVVYVGHWSVPSIGFDNPDIDSTRINVKQNNTANPKINRPAD
jgi:hypothetical protein